MLKVALVGCGRIAKRHSELLGNDKLGAVRGVDLASSRRPCRRCTRRRAPGSAHPGGGLWPEERAHTQDPNHCGRGPRGSRRRRPGRRAAPGRP